MFNKQNLANEMLKEVDEYSYLGQVVSADTNDKKGIRCSVTTGRREHSKHSNKQYATSVTKKKSIQPVHTRGDDFWHRNLGI